MIAVFKPKRKRGNVEVTIFAVGSFWVWTVVYDQVKYLFDGWGITKSRSKAFDKVTNKVQKIINYENRGGIFNE